MLPDERYAVILDEVARQPAVSIRSLTERLGVSRETVRKDIETLAKQGKLAQIRGGATPIVTQEAPISDRVLRNAAGKSRIAALVAAMIPDNASLIIDNGSSTLEVARALSRRHQGLYVYTNDLKLAELIGPACREVVVLGGRLDLAESATFGVEVIENLSRYRAEFALISAGGLSARAGFTDFSREAADLRARMLEQAETPMILADHSKFGVIGQVVMPEPPVGTILVTDEHPDGDILRALKNTELQVAR
ncbi:DeoR/GlpR family DNA-binding transcription regulator [Roseibium sp.]|uniref:DeoR/GlpR family DNA-binding transcription regulator n=1 Tax=Roseibium sp. TaxID=1936156 RepID=UPI003D0B0EAC